MKLNSFLNILWVSSTLEPHFDPEWLLGLVHIEGLQRMRALIAKQMQDMEREKVLVISSDLYRKCDQAIKVLNEHIDRIKPVEEGT